MHRPRAFRRVPRACGSYGFGRDEDLALEHAKSARLLGRSGPMVAGRRPRPGRRRGDSGESHLLPRLQLHLGRVDHGRQQVQPRGGRDDWHGGWRLPIQFHPWQNVGRRRREQLAGCDQHYRKPYDHRKRRPDRRSPRMGQDRDDQCRRRSIHPVAYIKQGVSAPLLPRHLGG